MDSLFQNKSKEAIVFDPSNTHDEKYYNLFRGFPYDDPDVDDLDEASSKVLQLMNHLCVNDASYFLDWISRMIQNPGKRQNGQLYFTLKQAVWVKIV